MQAPLWLTMSFDVQTGYLAALAAIAIPLASWRTARRVHRAPYRFNALDAPVTQ